ncbi:hypothetical protein GCM10010294_11240 [Streptomyces griseoloalbus]|nr:hypothetical protein GCM10010294_11240 [Streptomyces griseoloalbus]
MLDQGAPPHNGGPAAPPSPGPGARLMRRKPVEHLVAQGGQGEAAPCAAPSDCGSSP